MNTRFLLSVCLGLLFVGCNDNNDPEIKDFTELGSGPVAEFIVTAINDHGGGVALPDEEFDLGDTWRHAGDEEGVQIFLYDSDFSDVAFFLREVLGNPDTDSGSYDFDSAMEEGGGWYAVRDKDVAVSYWDVEGEYVHVIVLRPQGF